ncbi:aminopeptidase P family protein [Candidatus Dependentiae bacterium]|nr:aminopeptidase P family protein [Candidatus Dependentiae bacterium]
MIFVPPQNKALFKERRKRLREALQDEYPHLDSGIIMLSAGFETSERAPFRQESSFYYLTGLTEPAAVLCMHWDGKEYLYLPRYADSREKWVNVTLKIGQDANDYGFDEIRPLGEIEKGYSFHPLFEQHKYENLLKNLKQSLHEKSHLFTLLDLSVSGYMFPIMLQKQIQEWFPLLKSITQDISPLVHEMRRFKDQYEIDLIYKAVQLTLMAQQAAAREIGAGKFEYQVQAAIEYMFTYVASTNRSFPSIVATGKNTTILHYVENNQQIMEEDLVVVDIGAEYGLYAADLTRTYPANGKFTPRQREIYQLVLDTQQYIESIAKPGMYLKNSQYQDESLHHLAVGFLKKAGYADYFVHGIGHYLGLDVHDVGDYSTPLMPGDVFTIEPGIYIPDEKLGVRIEDDYVMTDDGAVCLSFDLPRQPDEIERWMQTVRE